MLLARPRTAIYLPGQKPPIGTPLDTAHPLAYGLVGAWTLNEGSGLVYNAAQQMESGVAPTTANALPTWGVGKFGAELTFIGSDGTNGNAQAISFGSNARYQLQDQTFAAWVRTGSIATIPPHGAAYILISRSLDITAGGFEWGIHQNFGNPQLAFAFYNGSVQGWYQDSLTLSTATEYFLAATWTSGTVRFYVNGVQSSSLATASGPISHVSGHNLQLGFQASSSSYQNSSFDGQMHQMLLYSRVLTAAEIAALYAEPFQVFRQRDAGHLVTLVTTGGAISGSGGITIGPPALAAAGAEAFSGSGALAIGAPALAATAIETFIASGNATIGHPALAALGAETFSGAGAATIGPPSLAGTGAEAFDGSGALAIGHPTLAASGAAGDVITGSGAILIGPPSLSAAALETFLGSGAVVISVPSLAASALETFAGSGALTIGPPALSGFGTIGDVINGVGALTIGPPSLTSSGIQAFTGSGALSVGAPSLAASGLIAFSGAGGITIGAPVLTASGLVLLAVVGSGGIVISGPSILGTETVLLPVPRLFVTLGKSGASSVTLLTTGRSQVEVP